MAGARGARRRRDELRGRISSVTGQFQYVVDQALDGLIACCRETRLRLTRSERETCIGATVLLTISAMNFSKGGSPRHRR